jgi:hypothetical protein
VLVAVIATAAATYVWASPGTDADKETVILMLCRDALERREEHWREYNGEVEEYCHIPAGIPTAAPWPTPTPTDEERLRQALQEQRELRGLDTTNR